MRKVFNTPFWRRAVLAALGVVAFYKYAPAPGDDNAIAKYISSTMTHPDVWSNTAFSHLVRSAQISDNTLLMTDAKPPVVHRYRFPQCVSFYTGLASIPSRATFLSQFPTPSWILLVLRRFEQYSPHLQPVGIKYDAGDVVVKRD